MDQNKLKAYAQDARRDFIAAVTDRAAFHGLTSKGIEPVVERGDVVLIGTRAFPRDVATKRKGLEERVRRDGFEQTMEAMAYTWFNRFAAIRYMELHGFLDHGYRVLSHPEGQEQPEILDHAADVDLQGLDREKAVELKLEGTKDEELYRLLLLAQCNALHRAMPFLFERIGDETELLLPANLRHTDSLIRRMVEGIEESDWDEIEIIGWLYQFYISEKKDQVIGKVVKSEDIPAATQLFTPNWIVKYMVQNSLGAQWLATYPHSPLKGQMEYCIEPADQTEEVKTQLKAITPDSLNPEELTLIDPACGSGHILVEAYDLFKAIYLERGYRQRDVPKLVLERNLFGLDIDERAAQLAGFALMMVGRADDRRLFERDVTLNVAALVDSTDFESDRLAEGVQLADYGLQGGDLTELKRLFEHASTFGSLIRIPEGLAAKLTALKQLSEATSQDLFVSSALKSLGPLVQQSGILAAQYDAVVANPPYMGKGMNTLVKKFAKDEFSDAKSDLFACFVERAKEQSTATGRIGIVAPFVWMFLSSFKRFRERVIDETSLTSLIQLEYNAFEPAMVPVAVFTLMRRHVSNFTGSYIKLSEFKGHMNQAPRTLQAILDPACGWLYQAKPDDFKKIPGSPVAYWVSNQVRLAFEALPPASEFMDSRQGLSTGNNDRYVRFWTEVPVANVGFDCSDRTIARESGKRWFPYNKGGELRKWSGNRSFVVDWSNDGHSLQTTRHPDGERIWAHNFNLDHIFQASVTWSDITSGGLSLRLVPKGYLFDGTGLSAFPRPDSPANVMLLSAGLGNSKLGTYFARILNPTLHFLPGDFSKLPLASQIDRCAFAVVIKCAELASFDWDAYERSWDFRSLPILKASSEPKPALKSSYTAWTTQIRDTIAEMKRLEEENNRLFIDAYGLGEELTPEVSIEQITLTVNPAYRYGGKLSEEEQWTRFRQDTMQEFVSYAVGCMMGRYSLDEAGLIYAHSGNVGFDPKRYTRFPADHDGIIPITDGQWFDDDAAHRLIEFISVAWDASHFEDNLTFLAHNLSPRKSESSRDTIRRYLYDTFFKDHLQTYKKRPIYWLFSSGKSKAFQCLVYLHRYNEGTLARMRTEYVVPLQGMMASRVRQLDGDIAAAASTAHRKRLDKERATLVKQQSELQDFDEKLRHYADQRINLDLDDGVKVNYGKFGDLLAEVKKVTGGRAE